MSAPLTLYVTHTDRDPEIARDALTAARWATKHACKTVLVVSEGQMAQYADCGADAVYETAVVGDFKFYDGIWQALYDDIKFDQVVCFRDDAMFLGKEVDDKLGRIFYAESSDFIGVADRHYYGDSFMRQGAFFSQWRLPHEIWDKPPATATAHSAVFALTEKLARELFYRRVLVPPNYKQWWLPFGAYATWTCQLLMMPVTLRGSMDRPSAPLYVNDGWNGAYNPPPYLLHPGIALYWSLRHVVGYSERETRTWCQSLREANP